MKTISRFSARLTQDSELHKRYNVLCQDLTPKFSLVSALRRGSIRALRHEQNNQNAEPPEDIILNPDETALLIIDIQNTYLDVPQDPEKAALWKPFHERMNDTVIPKTALLADLCRKHQVEVMYARIACQKNNGRDRSLSQKKPGFNYLLLPKDETDSQIVEELTPKDDEITVLKTTDSALTGTNLRLILHNMGIRNVIVSGMLMTQK